MLLLGLPDDRVEKTRPDIETPSALMEKENEEGVSPSLVHQQIRRSVVAPPAGRPSRKRKRCILYTDYGLR